MKLLPTLLIKHMSNRISQRNLKIVFNFLLILAFLVTLYSVLFHYIMIFEDREYSWITGFYWTLTVMSTLGFGDITFHTDIGKIFSIVVLLSGVVLLLVMLPFTLIEFFYEPWIKAQTFSRVPRVVPDDLKGHVILFQYDQITSALIEKLTLYHYPYVLVIPDFDEALRLHDEGLVVIYADHDDPETYRKARVDHATLIAATSKDIANTTIAFTVRDVNETIPIVATVSEEYSVDILKNAGGTTLLHLGDMTGQAFARRLQGGQEAVHVIGQLDELLIAEVNADLTLLAGKTLLESRIRERTGVNIIGIWERGKFENAQAHTVVTPKMVLVMSGTRSQLDRFEELCQVNEMPDAPVIIVGAGRVGRAVAKALDTRKMDYRIIDYKHDRLPNNERLVVGNAANPEVLIQAGIENSPAVIITTQDDDTNIYLTIYCRKRYPNIQIISRTSQKRNISTLRRAGVDFVISYATMGAEKIFNSLKRSDILMVAEGLDVFRIKTPAALIGKAIRDTSIRNDTGCNIIAVHSGGQSYINPDINVILQQDSELVLIGTDEAENSFLNLYPE